MNVGMLWFDNDPKANLDAKIERAASYYQNKYGRHPTLCYVHPSMLAGKLGDKPGNGKLKEDLATSEKNYAACGIEIRSNHSVLPNHFWIGVNGGAGSNGGGP